MTLCAKQVVVKSVSNARVVYCERTCPIHSWRLKKAMAQALAQLSKREQVMLSFYYEHEMNLKEIGLVFELTEARVSQIHKKALKSLNSMLTDWRESV